MIKSGIFYNEKSQLSNRYAVLRYSTFISLFLIGQLPMRLKI